MADQNLGTLYTPIEARLEPFARSLKEAEVMAREGAKKIEKASEVDLGATGGKLGGGAKSGKKSVAKKGKKSGGALGFGLRVAAGLQASSAAFAAINVGAELFRGGMENVRETIFQMPLGIGQLARALDSILDGGQLDKMKKDFDEVNAKFQRTLQQAAKRDAFKADLGGRLEALGGKAAEAGLEGFDLERARANAGRFDQLQAVEKREQEAKKLQLDISTETAMERELIERNTAEEIRRINKRESEETEREAKRLADIQTRIAEDVQKTKERQADELTAMRDDNDVDQLRSTDSAAAERLKIELDTTAKIKRATADGNLNLIPEIERQKALRLAGVEAGARGQQIDDISRMAIGSGANIRAAAKQEEPVTKKQGETQIGVLRDMLSAITRLRMEATAN